MVVGGFGIVAVTEGENCRENEGPARTHSQCQQGTNKKIIIIS
jgi:hypothetical protein